MMSVFPFILLILSDFSATTTTDVLFSLPNTLPLDQTHQEKTVCNQTWTCTQRVRCRYNTRPQASTKTSTNDQTQRQEKIETVQKQTEIKACRAEDEGVSCRS